MLGSLLIYSNMVQLKVGSHDLEGIIILDLTNDHHGGLYLYCIMFCYPNWKCKQIESL